MYFEIYERERSVVASLRGSRLMGGGDWRWRLKRDDDQIVASGDGYPTRSQCERAVFDLKQEIAAAPLRFL
ncbi:YegP family protein [Sphingosinicella sp. CPCC 101087]|uniref:YegP family protein n=1 Tax=Sphingosinicella sp. CPCC 101087 TaxID=2497754 RepID=UPI00101B83F9|nr:YegP family protein [Sphingosinicella sp. CPCC 101087]